MSLNKIVVLVLFLVPFDHSAQVLSIAQARSLPTGVNVVVRGIVTNGGELGKIRYLQDGTAGIAAFPGAGSMPGFDTTVQPGDSIEVTGPTVLFHNLLEINPITGWQVISSGNPAPAPRTITLSQVSDALEGQLVRVDCASFGGAGGVFAATGTYEIVDTDGIPVDIYLRSGHPLQNTSIPGNPVELTAILSQYDDFQLLPRSADDIAAANCFYFSEKPQQSDIQTTGFRISWETSLPSSAKLRFGGTPNPLNEIDLPTPMLSHSFELTDLAPGLIYWVQIAAVHNGDTILSGSIPFATRSLSSGQIKIYFNHPIDESVANGLAPAGQNYEAVLNETIARIDAAQQTIDVAMYNNNRDDITLALDQARTRGVRVRYIAALDALNAGLIPAPSFPVVYGNDVALMHNKFMVTDAGLADKCWVMSGSLNWTNGNMTQDFNNTLFIQDQSLAHTYEWEFEEMWGSDGDLPDPANGRFGAAKQDNTPHQFIIGGIPVESYFSPSDQVSGRISDAIFTVDSEALFATFSYTYNDLSYALLDAKDNGAEVRGMIENIGDPGSEFNYLLSQGVEVKHHDPDGDLHHKYAVMDAAAPTSAPLVVTGSHNWTSAAETVNDENTLIIHDADIARLYKAEFERRWSENAVSTQSPVFQKIESFPNPVSDYLYLRLDAAASGNISIKNILGASVLQSVADSSGISRLNVGSLSPGFYFAVVEVPYGIATVSFQKI